LRTIGVDLPTLFTQLQRYATGSGAPRPLGPFPSRVSVVDDRLKREVEDSPNTKYRSRSALLQERVSKLVAGSGELATRVEPATIGCEA
jgi:hypothetical protein